MSDSQPYRRVSDGIAGAVVTGWVKAGARTNRPRRIGGNKCASLRTPVCASTIGAMAVAPTEPDQRTKRNVRVRTTCRRCGRLVVHNSRKGIYTRCQCGAYVPGPAMMDSLAAEPDPDKTRRLRRKRERQPAEGTQPDPRPAPAPVRRKAKAGGAAAARQPTHGPVDAPAGSRPATPAQPSPAPPRRGLLDRLLFGGDP